jgi:DNA-binding NtrC family response regulator
LEIEIKQGRFRADLYDRLRFSVIHLPPLRDRREDIQPLVDYFTGQICDEVPSIARRTFAASALATLESYAWPGNVRELKFAVERALCVARASEVKVQDLPHEVRGEGGVAVEGTGDFDEQIAAVERGLLSRALEQTGGRQKDAAQQLGLTYDRFRHLLRKHQIIGK